MGLERGGLHEGHISPVLLHDVQVPDFVITPSSMRHWTLELEMRLFRAMFVELLVSVLSIIDRTTTDGEHFDGWQSEERMYAQDRICCRNSDIGTLQTREAGREYTNASPQVVLHIKYIDMWEKLAERIVRSAAYISVSQH